LVLLFGLGFLTYYFTELEDFFCPIFQLCEKYYTLSNDYNTDFPHQSLMFATPNEFYKNWINKELDLHKKILA